MADGARSVGAKHPGQQGEDGETGGLLDGGAVALQGDGDFVCSRQLGPAQNRIEIRFQTSSKVYLVTVAPSATQQVALPLLLPAAFPAVYWSMLISD